MSHVFVLEPEKAECIPFHRVVLPRMRLIVNSNRLVRVYVASPKERELYETVAGAIEPRLVVHYGQYELIFPPPQADEWFLIIENPSSTESAHGSYRVLSRD